MRWATVLAGLLLVTAGCLGGGDDGGVPEADDGDAGAGGSTSFATETYEGEVTGATVPMGGSVSGNGNNQASFQVPNGARVLYLNVTTEGGDLDMQYGPDCQTDPTVSCSNNATTQDGSLTVRVTDPTSATWDAFFFIAEDTAAGQVSWTMDVTVGVVTSG